MNKSLAVSEISDINMGSVNLFFAQMSFRMLTNMVHWWMGWPMGKQSALLGRTYWYNFSLVSQCYGHWEVGAAGGWGGGGWEWGLHDREESVQSVREVVLMTFIWKSGQDTISRWPSGNNLIIFYSVSGELLGGTWVANTGIYF